MSVAGVPVRPVARNVAVIVVVPAETAVTSPCDPVLLLTSAIAVLNEAQDTNSVIFFGVIVGALEKAAVAVNCVEVPTLMIATAGAIVRSVTLTVILLVIDGWAISTAVITAVPSFNALTSPVVLTVATVVSDDCHVTWVQKSKNFPSVKCAVTNSCFVVSLAMN